jgi:hypothetical protein
MKIFLLLNIFLYQYQYQTSFASIVDTRGANLIASCCNPSISSTNSINLASPAVTFSLIYNRSHWGNRGGGSGEGSDIQAASGARSIIENVLTSINNLSSFADIGVGSFIWLPSILDKVDNQRKKEGLDSIHFIGVDVVKTLIDTHTERYKASRPHWLFRFGDAASFDNFETIPKNIDVILCRDALQHLPLMLVVQALENMLTSGARYLLLGSYNVFGPNCDMSKPGFFSWISLSKFPLLLPEPQVTYDEGFEAKRMLLYNCDILKKQLNFTQMRERVRIHQPPIDINNACGSLPE